jgi:hypothetical protein
VQQEFVPQTMTISKKDSSINRTPFPATVLKTLALGITTISKKLTRAPNKPIIIAVNNNIPTMSIGSQSGLSLSFRDTIK